MIVMKIEDMDNKIIIYLYNSTINIDDTIELNNKIKDVFIKIMKRNNYDFFGYNEVTIYHNSNYGIILEVEKKTDNSFNYRTIDLKIKVYKDVLMYLEFDDYCFNNRPKKLIYYDNKYYLKIDRKLNIYKYLEFAKIKYKKMINEID